MEFDSVKKYEKASFEFIIYSHLLSCALKYYEQTNKTFS